ncbi:MAG: chromate efflux transporter, partial [Pseudomonadota bacterium]|nr:chromate efflux transporter [Pseudomonadota bacterium]
MKKPTNPAAATNKPFEVFLVFLKLGLTSFGGPIAHIGYFRTELVERRRWVSDSQFSQLLAISQFLPGPTSSQLGFCMGLLRGGWLGAVAAFVAFTLPSVLLLLAFVAALPLLSGPVSGAVVHGLKLVACAVVAHAILGMAKTLCDDTAKRTIAVLTSACLLASSGAATQLFVVLAAALGGALFLSDNAQSKDFAKIKVPYGAKLGGVCIGLFVVLLIGFTLVSTGEPQPFSIAAAFYQAGALVFGGGHVVLPLLEESVVGAGWVSTDQFLAGYGASQAIPGPMFAFAAYLGAVISPQQHAAIGVIVALTFIFLPGFLLIAGVLPFWQRISKHVIARRAISGVNAAVVGLLA